MERRSREVTVRGGTAKLEEPVGHCSTCRRDFFPPRSVLKLDGHSDSPTIPHRILHRAGVSSFDVAAVALPVVGEMVISDRQINKLTTEVGQQLQQE